MAFRKYKGRTKNMWMPVTASTAIAAGALVTYSSGQLVAATSSTGAADIAGVLVKAIASTDSDYATGGRLVEVMVPLDRHTVWEALTASLVTTDVGAEVDLTDSVTVNRGASSIKAVRIAGYLSATKALVHIKINGSY